jgi:tetratricopeptide (TPR) repeat protein
MELYISKGGHMELFAIDFYEKWYKRCNYYDPDKFFCDDDFYDLMRQANTVIENEEETKHKRAEACVRKFQLLETQYKLAPKLLEHALVLYPDMPQALTSMGCFYLHIKDRENAITCFNKAIGSDPLFPYSWLQKAYIEEDKEEKLRFLSEFIKLKPDSIIGYEKRRDLLLDIEYDRDSLLAHKKIKLIKIDLQNAIDDYSELIRLVPTEDRYYECRANLYIKISGIEFMLSDDDDKFPSVINNAVKDIRKLMALTPENGLDRLLSSIRNMLIDLPDETIIKYIDQIASNLSPDTNEYWIAQILYKILFAYNKYEKSIEIYTNIINSVKDGSFLQIYSYYNRSQTYLYMKEYEKALHDNEIRIRLCSLLPDKRYHPKQESDLYYAMIDRIRIFEEMKDIKGVIDVYTNILEAFKGKSESQRDITDAYMERAKIYKKNKDIEKALADYSAVIESGVTGIEYKVKDAYVARIAINKNLGETDKVSADYKKMAELKEDTSPDVICDDEEQKFVIIDLELKENMVSKVKYISATIPAEFGGGVVSYSLPNGLNEEGNNEPNQENFEGMNRFLTRRGKPPMSFEEFLAWCKT